ncbi:60S ribosomal protein L23 [Elsinoe australis]|uniref:60S ribosomal protein L23 n=1 Tax=Elsinoe australis TaxID=40998 RepID=A0A2P7YVT3_9PEZI|nr:60S ribosomal protein L23 [Elsinoe australis]
MMQANGYESESSAGRTTSSPITNGTIPLRPGIQEAVNNAFDKSPAGEQYDPNLVAEITEQVLGALKAKGVTAQSAQHRPEPAPQQSTNSVTPQQTPQHGPRAIHTDIPSAPLNQPIPSAARHAVPISPTSPASSHMPTRYTPPSPTRYETSSRGSSSPEPQHSDPGSFASKETRGSRRDSKSSMSGQEDMTGSRQRQRPVRIPSSVEETSLEKAWKPLFDNGKPTARLGQFLRGLARHIIDDCKPPNSIVVTPGKLADFFDATKVNVEMYPWTQVFGGQLTNQAISRLFLNLRCQHHLVQFGLQDAPSIPGLTPQGFETLMTMLIQAHPDQEFQRLDKATRDMPISNADAPSERFPKQLTRRLFPASGDTQQQQRLTAALSSEPGIKLNHSNPLPPPPPTQPPMSSSQHSSFSERERAPYSASAAFSSVIEDDDLRATSTSIPIERERKPYIAREGSGRTFEDPAGMPQSIPPSMKAESGPRPIRANSAVPVQPPFAQPSRPTDIPNSVPRSHRMSMNGATSLRYGASPAHSTMHNNPYTRSEGTNVNDIPASYYASNIRDYDDEPQRRDPRRAFRRQNTEDEMSRGFGVRSIPVPGYDHPSGYSHRPHANSEAYGSFPGHPPPQHIPRYS